MKYLKMFESASMKDLLTQLEEKTGINIIKPEIDELLIDVKDQLPNITISKDLSINLTYRRKNVRKSTISYDYYTEIVEKGHREYVTDINYIRDFLDKCELATSMSMKYWVTLNVTFDSTDDLLVLRTELKNIESRAKSLDYDFNICDRKAKDQNESIDNLLSDEKIESWSGYAGRNNRITLYLLFECEIDKDNLKSNIDFSTKVPANIVTDFIGFLDKWRVPNNNKLELVNIIKRGDWSDNTKTE
jgi:hypothetical protein